MELYEYDPTQPPPEVIGISLEEYDRFRNDISTLLDAHKLLRKAEGYFSGENWSAEQVQDYRESLAHFFMAYRPE